VSADNFSSNFGFMYGFVCEHWLTDNITNGALGQPQVEALASVEAKAYQKPYSINIHIDF
jgi:hypothetical protein